jgi:hypothetical protein
MFPSQGDNKVYTFRTTPNNISLLLQVNGI